MKIGIRVADVTILLYLNADGFPYYETGPDEVKNCGDEKQKRRQGAAEQEGVRVQEPAVCLFETLHVGPATALSRLQSDWKEQEDEGNAPAENAQPVERRFDSFVNWRQQAHVLRKRAVSRREGKYA